MNRSDRPRLSRITIYPLKSFPGHDVTRVAVLPSGALARDRRWALVDETGQLVTAKRTPLIHRFATHYADDLSRMTITDRATQATGEFCLTADRVALAEFCAGPLGMKLRVIEDAERGWPDDGDAPGATVVSRATCEAVADWFDDLTVENVSARFRANLELDGVEPFWEDRLYGEVEMPVTFRIGAITLDGVNPCQRCVVPTRDPVTAEVTTGFAKRFATERERTLPVWANRNRFDHFYRLTVNTRLNPSCRGGWLSVGDEVSLEVQ